MFNESTQAGAHFCRCHKHDTYSIHKLDGGRPTPVVMQRLGHPASKVLGIGPDETVLRQRDAGRSSSGAFTRESRLRSPSTICVTAEPSNVCMSGRYKRNCVYGEDLSMDIFAGCEFIEGNDSRRLCADTLDRAARVFCHECTHPILRGETKNEDKNFDHSFTAGGSICCRGLQLNQPEIRSRHCETGAATVGFEGRYRVGDADKNTVTLGGTLHSDDAKTRAGDVAKQAAPDRTIANEISVQPVGAESQAKGVASNLDDGIENNYKAALISKRLDKQSIHYRAKNGVLTLTGSVKAPQQKSEAELLASKVPNVEQVVNQIEVKR